MKIEQTASADVAYKVTGRVICGCGWRGHHVRAGRNCPKCGAIPSWTARRKRGSRSLEEYFWKNVDKTSSSDGCWLWMRYTRVGYGAIHVSSGVWVSTHRFSWELANGQKIPDGLLVRHLCGNRLCVNPEHLATGTYSDNCIDTVKHGRAKTLKLTAEQVVEIRKRHQTGCSMAQLGRENGVYATTIRKIVMGLSWTHVA